MQENIYILSAYLQQQFPLVRDELSRLTSLVTEKLDCPDDEYIKEVIHIYFLLYTVPIFDRLGYWTQDLPEQRTNLENLLEAHMWLNVHLRLIDIVIDQDESIKAIPNRLRLAIRSLDQTRIAVEKAGHKWDITDQDFYELYLKYDLTVDSNHHELALNLWQRISPMLVVPERFLCKSLNEIDKHYYRMFLNFMLLIHDLGDLLKDYKEGHKTLPILFLTVHSEFSRTTMESVFNKTEMFLADFASQIFPSLDRIKYPLWTSIVQFCVRTHSIRNQFPDQSKQSEK